MPEPTQASTRTRGHTAETLACDYLQQQGLRLVMRNYSCKLGELDLIMRDGEQLVFVEVRSRRAGRHGTPLETVTPTKQRRLIRTAQHYLQRYRIDRVCRFDVVGITYHVDQPRIDWVPNAIQAYR